jgi:hypothetical protein
MIQNRMAAIAVYHFVCPDPNTGNDVMSSQFATLKAIKLCNGRNIEDSRRLVDVRELDANGYYQPPTLSKAAVRSA